MQLADAKSRMFIEYGADNNDKNPKFKVGSKISIPKCKSILANDYILNWPKEDFDIQNIKNTVPWAYVISDLNSKEVVRTFYEKNCKKQIKQSVELKK